MSDIRLHLGCGNVNIKGFTNIDVRFSDAVDMVDDVRYLKSSKSNSVSEIYACHILEHIERHQVHSVLSRWHDILKPGGVLRVAVPDFDAIVDHYLSMEGNTTPRSAKNLDDVMGLLYGGQNYPGNYHYYCWNINSMERDLSKIGFEEIRKYHWEDTEFAEFDDFSKAYLPHMDQTGQLMSLNVQAIKEG